jgi:hypothetical protein
VKIAIPKFFITTYTLVFKFTKIKKKKLKIEKEKKKVDLIQ